MTGGPRHRSKPGVGMDICIPPPASAVLASKWPAAAQCSLPLPLSPTSRSSLPSCSGRCVNAPAHGRPTYAVMGECGTGHQMWTFGGIVFSWADAPTHGWPTYVFIGECGKGHQMWTFRSIVFSWADAPPWAPDLCFHRCVWHGASDLDIWGHRICMG